MNKLNKQEKQKKIYTNTSSFSYSNRPRPSVPVCTKRPTRTMTQVKNGLTTTTNIYEVPPTTTKTKPTKHNQQQAEDQVTTYKKKQDLQEDKVEVGLRTTTKSRITRGRSK